MFDKTGYTVVSDEFKYKTIDYENIFKDNDGGGRKTIMLSFILVLDKAYTEVLRWHQVMLYAKIFYCQVSDISRYE